MRTHAAQVELMDSWKKGRKNNARVASEHSSECVSVAAFSVAEPIQSFFVLSKKKFPNLHRDTDQLLYCTVQYQHTAVCATTRRVSDKSPKMHNVDQSSQHLRRLCSGFFCTVLCCTVRHCLAAAPLFAVVALLLQNQGLVPWMTVDRSTSICRNSSSIPITPDTVHSCLSRPSPIALSASRKSRWQAQRP